MCFYPRMVLISSEFYMKLLSKSWKRINSFQNCCLRDEALRATARIDSNLLTAFVKSFEELQNIFVWDLFFLRSKFCNHNCRFCQKKHIPFNLLTPWVHIAKDIYLQIFLVELWGFENCQFGQVLDSFFARCHYFKLCAFIREWFWFLQNFIWNFWAKVENELTLFEFVVWGTKRWELRQILIQICWQHLLRVSKKCGIFMPGAIFFFLQSKFRNQNCRFCQKKNIFLSIYWLPEFI